MRTRDRSFWTALAASTTVALVCAVAVVVVFGDGGRDDGATASTPTGPAGLDLEPSAPDAGAMDVELLTFDGGTTSLSELIEPGRPTVVNFFASTCAPCVREMPAFEEVHQRVGDRVGFLGLATQDRPDDALGTVEATGITYDIARDAQGELIGAVGSPIMPTTVFVGADGTIAEVHPGELDRDELLDLLAELFGVEAA